MTAFHIAEKIPIKDVAEAFASKLLDASSTDAMFRMGDDSYVMVHVFGAVAFFNVPPEQQQSLIAKLQAISPKLDGEMASDDFLISMPRGAPLREGVHFDRAVLADLDPNKIEILGLILAQSVTLEYYERIVEDLLDQAEAITSEMKTGRLPRYTRSTIRYIGMSLSTRRDLISGLYIFDEPEVTWQDSAVARLFSQMKSTMEINTRYLGLEYKLKLIQEGVEVIVDLTNANRNIFLEAIIVVLIVVEIVLAFTRFGH